MKQLVALVLTVALVVQLPSAVVINSYRFAAAAAVPAWVQDDAATFDPFNTTRAVTFSASTTSGNMIAVFYRGSDDTGITTISATDSKSNTYTKVVDGATSHIPVLVAYNITGGSSHAVTITLGASNGNSGVIMVAEYSGIATSSAFDQGAQNADFIANISATTGTTTQASELVIAVGRVNGITPTAGSGFTYRTVTSGLPLEDKVVSATGTQLGNFTHAEATASISVATFKAQ